MDEFPTYSPFEDLVVRARSGCVSKQELIQSFWVAQIVLPSGAPAEGASEVVPLFFEQEGRTMLAVFTDPRRIGEFSDIATFLVTMTGRDIMVRLPPHAGIIVNPTSAEVAFEISPEVVALTIQNMDW